MRLATQRVALGVILSVSLDRRRDVRQRIRRCPSRAVIAGNCVDREEAGEGLRHCDRGGELHPDPRLPPPPDGGGQVYGARAWGLRSGAGGSLKAVGVAGEISLGSSLLPSPEPTG